VPAFVSAPLGQNPTGQSWEAGKGIFNAEAQRRREEKAKKGLGDLSILYNSPRGKAEAQRNSTKPLPELFNKNCGHF
jgi:hypothetical protein